jgi:hypothetical protein
VDKEGFREVLAMKVAGCGKSAAYTLGVFANQTSAQILATEILLRSGEDWSLKRYLRMNGLAMTKKPTIPNTRDSDKFHCRRTCVASVQKHLCS